MGKRPTLAGETPAAVPRLSAHAPGSGLVVRVGRLVPLRLAWNAGEYDHPPPDA